MILVNFLSRSLAGHTGPKTRVPDRLVRIVDQNCRIIVKAYVGAVLAAMFLRVRTITAFTTLPFLNLAVGLRFLHCCR